AHFHQGYGVQLDNPTLTFLNPLMAEITAVTIPFTTKGLRTSRRSYWKRPLTHLHGSSVKVGEVNINLQRNGSATNNGSPSIRSNLLETRSIPLMNLKPKGFRCCRGY
ncbi:hypothetical protein J7E50_20240, partial [Pedobacter sp. ISL-68]|uniref:hypothetical protein n=1 Tax=Pedobacter sp. ISL-68 TaxID=2819165 RepID=UPI001BEC2F9C